MENFVWGDWAWVPSESDFEPAQDIAKSWFGAVWGQTARILSHFGARVARTYCGVRRQNKWAEDKQSDMICFVSSRRFEGVLRP